MRGRIAALSAALLGAGFAVAGSAQADTAPQLPCGSTVFESCTDSAHFSNIDEWQTPLGQTAPGCPAYLAASYVRIEATGNGVEHNTINKSDGFHTSTTFSGEAVLTFYGAADVDVTVIDDEGDVTATPTGAATATLTGRLTEHFGVEETPQGLVFGLTFAFEGADGNGTPVRLHVTQHRNWNPTHPKFVGPPQHAASSVHC
jgi:hypothetical protein